MLYRRLIPVTREGAVHWRSPGPGQPVEWLLEMVRFDQDSRLDRIAARELSRPRSSTSSQPSSSRFMRGPRLARKMAAMQECRR